MKFTKLSTVLAIATLPFFASCASWNTATISNGLKNKNITYAQAREALENGADVKENWLGRCFLEEAAEQNRRDLIELFVEKGGVSCFEADAGKVRSPFSLFMYAYKKQDADLMFFCLKHPDKSKEVMRLQLVEVANQMFDLFVGNYSRISRGTWASEHVLSEICETGLLTDDEVKLFSPETIKAIKTQKFLKRCASGDIRHDERGYRHTGTNFIAKDAANAKDKNGNSALVLFLKNCDDLREKDLEAFVSAGADVNAKSSDGESVLYLCLRHKNRSRECLEILQKAGARFTKEEATAILMKIVEEKDDSFAGFTWNGLVLQGADVNAKIGEHSLLYVAKLNNSEYASVLEDAGAKLLPEEVAQLQKKLNEDLKKAIGGGDLEAVERCIKAGADVNDKVVAKDGKMYSPLFLIEIASSGSFGYPVSKIRKLLLDAGASKMSEEEAAMTSGLRLIRALAFVPHQGWNPIAQAVKSGEINLKAEFDGQNAFHMIADLDFSEISFFREKAETIDESFIVALKNAEVNINKKSRVNMTPLAVAIENSNNIAVMVFLRHGANPNDTIPIKGAFGDAGQKTLMSFAIECYNRLVDASRSGQDIDRNVIKRANEIVSLMAEATGTKVTDL